MARPPIFGYWPVGATGGVDLSGYGHPAVFTGSATALQRGPVANKGSRLFSGGTSDYGDCGNGVILADRGTFSFWIKWVNRQTAPDAGYGHNILSKRDGAGSIFGAYNIYFLDSRGTSESLNLAFRDSTTYRLKRSPSLAGLITEDVWYHFALVFDLKNAGNTFFYLNGNLLGGPLQGDDTTPDTWVETPTNVSTRIGYSSNSGSSVNAYLGEVAILGTRLTAAQVREYYNSSIGVVTTAKVPLSTIPLGGASPSVTETALATDAIESYLSSKWQVVAEEATAADTVSGWNTVHHAVVNELATVSDLVDYYAQTKSRHITETALAADAIAATVSTHWGEVSEQAVVQDTIKGNFEKSREITEAATAGDTVIGRIPKELEANEAAVAADALGISHTYVSAAKSGRYKLYLDGVIRTTFFLKYRQDYDCTEKVYSAPVRQEYTVWQTVMQRYRQLNSMEMVHVPVSTRLTYDLATTAIFRRNWNGGLQAFNYTITEPFTFQSRQYENITERTRVDLRQRSFYSVRENDDFSENVSYTYKVTLDGLDYTDKVKHLNFSYSLEQYTGECSITWADPQMYAQLDPLTNMGAVRIEVFTGHYGFALVSQGQFLIEKRSTEIDASKAYPTTWGRTSTARLAAPHSLPITKTWMNDTKALTIALEVMQLASTGLQLNWQVTDYDVLGGNFVAAGDEPISLLTRLAEPLGAIVTTNKQGQVVVRYKYV